MREAAAVLGVSPRTADSLWAYARAWLLRQAGRRSTFHLIVCAFCPRITHEERRPSPEAAMVTERDVFMQAFQEPDLVARRALLDQACGERFRPAAIAWKACCGRRNQRAVSSNSRHRAIGDANTPIRRRRPHVSSVNAECRRLRRHAHRPVQAARASSAKAAWARVCLAEQTEPVQRRVALKLIKPGMDSRAGAGPVRGRAAGPGPDGPPEHRQGARRGRHAGRPAVLRHGAGQGRAASPSTATSTG